MLTEHGWTRELRKVKNASVPIRMGRPRECRRPMSELICRIEKAATEESFYVAS